MGGILGLEINDLPAVKETLITHQHAPFPNLKLKKANERHWRVGGVPGKAP